MRVRTVLLTVVAAMFAACSRNPVFVPFEGRPNIRFPGKPTPAEQGYQLGTGDRLKLTVRGLEEFNGEIAVDRMGKIRLPFTFQVVYAEGLTVPQLEAQVVEALRPYVRREPEVRLDLAAPNSKFVYVLGAVAGPGKYPIRDERLDVREAVVRAGWPLRGVAALNRAKLVSSDPDRNAARSLRLQDILYRGDLTENYELKEGDVVWVPYTYTANFVFHAKLLLEPFAVLLGFDVMANRLSYSPRAVRNEDNREWEYGNESGRGRGYGSGY